MTAAPGIKGMSRCFFLCGFLPLLLFQAKRLQSELAERKQESDIEYRFIAFTGENSPRCYDK
jgi:hypothetical protein